MLIAFLLADISSQCNETQIDINTASAERLDNLNGIGPAYAEKIVQERPFESVDDLIKVSGIGNKTLEKIKRQGLACVSGPNSIDDDSKEDAALNDESNKEEDKEKEEASEITEINAENPPLEDEISEKIELSPISLNSQSIKSENNSEILKRNLALLGIVTFCVIFGALFLLKVKKSKNEFK